MRLTEFTNPVQLDNDPNLEQRITEECGIALAAMRKTNKACFRGLGSVYNAFLGVPRDDRKPLDSSWTFHFAYQRMYEENQLEANRSNSIFVTSDYDQAKFYGKVYVIFPKDGFKFSWSFLSSDIAVPPPDEVKFLDRNKIAQFEAIVTGNANHALPMGQPFQWSFQQDVIGNLRRAQRDYHMDVAAYGYGSEFVDTALLQKNFQVKDTNFPAAVASGHEIAVKGPYYAVNVRAFRKMLERLVGPRALGKSLSSDNVL